MDPEKKVITRPTLASRGSGGATTGWDPYEVWRTKILLPRLADQERDRLASTAAAKRLYVVAPRTDRADSATPGGDRNDQDDARRTDEALRREMIDVIGLLLVAGLVGVFYTEVDRHSPTRLPVSRLAGLHQ